MPELPEIDGYVAGLRAHVAGQPVEEIRLQSPFLLRSVEPPLLTDGPGPFLGATLLGAERLAKRIVFRFPDEHFLVLHLMVAGRLRWKKRGAALHNKTGLLALDFPEGSICLTEQGSKRRASLFTAKGRPALASHDPGGLELLSASEPDFRGRIRTSGHTIKRALCTPRIVSGVGNAWSDEILWEARLSPMLRGASLSDEQSSRLFKAAVAVLTAAKARHVAAAEAKFPDKVTAFQEEMAVHGRFGEACRRCDAPIQRITRARGHDFHYCARCQTGGRVLGDRSLSRLLKDDWPRRIEDLM